MLMENYDCIFAHTRIPVATMSKARFCGRLSPVTVGSNIAGAWVSIMSVERCQVAVFAMGRSLIQESRN